MVDEGAGSWASGFEGFQNSGYLLGVHIKGSIVGGGLYWGALILGKYMKLPCRSLG